jgi:hypothetical protein
LNSEFSSFEKSHRQKIISYHEDYQNNERLGYWVRRNFMSSN